MLRNSVGSHQCPTGDHLIDVPGDSGSLEPNKLCSRSRKSRQIITIFTECLVGVFVFCGHLHKSDVVNEALHHNSPSVNVRLVAFFYAPLKTNNMLRYQ